VALLQQEDLPRLRRHLAVLAQTNEKAYPPFLQPLHPADPVKASVHEEEGSIAQGLDHAAQAVEKRLFHLVLAGEEEAG